MRGHNSLTIEKTLLRSVLRAESKLPLEHQSAAVDAWAGWRFNFTLYQ